jgi:hypothetical protein
MNKLSANQANMDYSSGTGTGTNADARTGFESKPRSRNAHTRTSQLISRIRTLLARSPAGEGREPEHRRQQHREPEQERRHALQPHRPQPPAAATAVSASACAIWRLRLSGALPHASRSHASRTAPAADDDEETRRPAIAAAGSRVGGGGGRGRVGRCLRKRRWRWARKVRERER